MNQVVWFRRDLRLADHPALCRAAAQGPVAGLIVLDDRLLTDSVRATRYLESVRDLVGRADGMIAVRRGRPEEVVPAFAAETGAGEVHVTGEGTPYGRARDDRVATALAAAGRTLVATGSPYAISPGLVRTGEGGGYRVFGPFSRAWRRHGWRRPWPEPDRRIVAADSDPVPAGTAPLPDPDAPVGERAAATGWAEFLMNRLAGYASDRDTMAYDATSGMSIPLKYGEIHPRTLLAGLAEAADTAAPRADVDKFVDELCWREFYADVLWHRPDSAWRDLRRDLAGLAYADPQDPQVAERIAAWRAGRTGFPLVDAGMRQLLGQGWMHNRVRMIAASFLVKHLHVWWPVGARWFLERLLDGDIASNNHGWQWVAGTGTDAAPYFRIFNPVGQGLRFDPDGTYVRRWLPELRHLPGRAAHEPWRHPDGYLHDYPRRIVDLATERTIALDRYAMARAAASGDAAGRGRS